MAASECAPVAGAGSPSHLVYADADIGQALAAESRRPLFFRSTDLARAHSAFALHMHQPLIPGDRPHLPHLPHRRRTSPNTSRSSVRGYENVPAPMDRAGSLFHTRLLRSGLPTSDPRYRRALFHLLTCQTSCFGYWGRGRWTDYGTEPARRAADAARALSG